jgi:tetratricopeptide (TPR) repeat protein
MICLVSCYCLNEEFEKALNMSKKLIDEYSDTEWVKSLEGEIYVIIGEIYAELEKFDKSIEYLKIGLEKAKGPLDKGVPCFEIGYVYEYGKGNIEQAKVWYRKVIDEYPNSEAVVEARKRLEELENKD